MPQPAAEQFIITYESPNAAFPTDLDIPAVMATVPGTVPTAGGWSYQNPFTRAAAAWTLPAGPARGLQFSTPLPQAGFFAMETLPLACRIAAALGLWAVPQGNPVRPYSAEDLYRQWSEANRRAHSATAKNPDCPLGGRPRAWCQPEQSKSWWDYMTNRTELRLAWPSADIYLPDLILFRRRESGQAIRALQWPEEANSLVIPPADFVIFRPRRRVYAGRPPAGFIPMADALAAVAHRLESYPKPLPHRLYRGGEQHHAAWSRLQNLPGTSPRAFAPTSPDLLIDLAPDAEIDQP